MKVKRKRGWGRRKEEGKRFSLMYYYDVCVLINLYKSLNFFFPRERFLLRLVDGKRFVLLLIFCLPLFLCVFSRGCRGQVWLL